MKFLIIRFSSIGDIVLTTPVVRCLKKQAAGAKVHYLTKKSFYPIVQHNPFIDRIHLLEENMNEVVDVLRKEKFDYIIDLHHNLRTLRIKKSLGVKSFSFNKLNIEKWLMVNLKWNRLPPVHIIDRYLDTLKSFDVKNDGLGLDYFIADNEKVKESDIPASHLAGYIGIAIGAQHATKKLPVHKLKELCEKLDHPVILLGGKEDYGIAETVASVDAVKIYNACGKFSINESADLVRRAKLIITHDTGLMHIAAAFKKPVISVWGNTIPEFGMYPYYGKYEVRNKKYEVKGLSCRPCSKIGYDKCPKGHFKCMEMIAVDEMVNDAMLLLKS
jgi:ADP-heptose:LPS heptosyltransferase